ncbi:MAG: hypothetical protein WCI22_16540, partial [Actinomycetota bacterium]
TKTTYDASLIATTTIAPTTTLPTGTVHELLPNMVQTVGSLSATVAVGQGEQEAATMVERYWSAMQTEMQANYPQYVDSFAFIVRRCRQAADRHRPADADRAFKNILELQTAIIG